MVNIKTGMKMDIPRKFDSFATSRGFGEAQNGIDTVLQVSGLAAELGGLATASFAIGVAGIGALVVGVFVGMGMPYAEASENLAKRGLRQGFTIGLATSLFEQPVHFLRNNFSVRGHYSGLIIYKHRAFNDGLMAGFVAGRRVSPGRREVLRNQLTTELDEFALTRVESCSWHEFILHYSRAVDKHVGH